MMSGNTAYYDLGLYRKNDIPVDETSDWTKNFDIIDKGMAENKQTAQNVNDQIEHIADSAVDISTTAGEYVDQTIKLSNRAVNANVDIQNSAVTARNAATVAANALTQATTANGAANSAKTYADNATAAVAVAQGNIEGLTLRIEALEEEE